MKNWACFLFSFFVFSTAFAADDDFEKKSESTAENSEVLESAIETPRDPWESFNRKMYSVHDVLYRGIIRPAGLAYEYGVPTPLHTTIRNGVANPEDAWIAANNLLQGKPKDAANDVARLLINSTLGIFGMFDVASELGLSKNDEDFGQTLAVWGVPSGNLVFIPGVGPRYVRDWFGWAVDSNPLWSVMDPPRTRNIAWGSNVWQKTEAAIPLHQMIESSGMEPYVMMRESYIQLRQSQITDGAPAFEEDDDYSKE